MGSQQAREEYADPAPPTTRQPFLFNLSRGELVQRQRLIDEAVERLRRCGCDIRRCRGGGVPSPERRQAELSLIVDHVTRALHHYNANNPGAEFDPVKALGYARALWVHVSFLARRRSSPVKPADEAAAAAADDDSDVKRGRKRRSRNKRNRAPPESPDKQFFAELRYDDYDSATVVTCTIIDKGKPHGFKTKCEFCPTSYGILHPGDGKYVCGKRNQRDEFFLLRNRLLSSDAILMAQERSREGATVSRAGPKQPGLGPPLH
uniref:DUF3615 domain-containing protein n=1 Tax=Oryza rufipogon TaxID=4529 RepID=A0A0E0NHR8_ORYRU